MSVRKSGFGLVVGGRALARAVGLLDGRELVPVLLLIAVSAALLWWSVPHLADAFGERVETVPTTHISAGSDCAFGRKTRIEFTIDADRPTTLVMNFRDIAPPTSSHPCEYIYVRFPGRLDSAYALGLSGPAMTTEVKETIFTRRPKQEPLANAAFQDASANGDVRFTLLMSKLPEAVRSGDITVKGEISSFLSSSAFADKVMHYWLRLPESRLRDDCETETECEDDYLADNPHVGSVNLILGRTLRLKSVLLAHAGQALTREGLTRITTEDLTGSVIAEDAEKAKGRDVTLLYCGTLFATGITVGLQAAVELIRLLLRADRRRFSTT